MYVNFNLRKIKIEYFGCQKICLTWYVIYSELSSYKRKVSWNFQKFLTKYYEFIKFVRLSYSLHGWLAHNIEAQYIVYIRMKDFICSKYIWRKFPTQINHKAFTTKVVLASATAWRLMKRVHNLQPLNGVHKTC